MPAEKIRTIATAAVKTPARFETIILLLSVYCLSEVVVVTPTNIVMEVYAARSSGASSISIDNPADIIRTTYTTTTVETVRSRCGDCNEHNRIGLADTNGSIVGNGWNHYRRSSGGGNSSNNFGKNNKNNYFGHDTEKTNNNSIITRSSIDSNNNTSIPKNTKLTHSSFRIEQHALKLLERAAATRDISLSSLVNKILKNYVTSEMYFEELGFILVSKNFLRKTFEGLDQKHIEGLGKEYGITIAKEYISYFYPQVNADTLLQFLEIWFKRFQSCQHRINERDDNNARLHYFTVNHDININFSLALQSILAGLIEPISRNEVEFTNVTPSIITFSFKVFRE